MALKESEFVKVYNECHDYMNEILKLREENGELIDKCSVY